MSDKEKSPYRRLEPLFRDFCHDQTPHVFLHQDQYGISEVSPGIRNYTEDELKALETRDFETRLFITSTTCAGDSVWLRTHWTDNHLHDSSLRVYRDFFKAFHATHNFTAAKSALSEALIMCMESDDSKYYSFAITMASGLSNMGENLSFQISNAMVKSEDEIEIARRKFCLMMHIIFTKMEISDFLWTGGASNIYRLVHCLTTVSNTESKQIVLPIFSFLLQIMLTVFVLFENISERHVMFGSFLVEDGDTTRLSLNVVLGAVTLIYSGFVAAPGLMEMQTAFKFYGGFGFLQVLDFIANVVVPFCILLSGFFIIANSSSYIDSVLNTAALLFITEIDDEFPSILGFNEAIIIKNFLIYQSLREFDAISLNKDENITRAYVKKQDEAIGVQFSDFYLTHWPEQGSTPENGVHFKPHEIISRMKGHGSQISPTNAVNELCLIRKITWCYTTSEKYKDTIKPRIGYLKLDMINGQTIEIGMKTVDKSLNVGSLAHELEGVFIITTFQMSSAILRLRVCGSYDATDFEKAFDYYCLWSITPHARELLHNHKKSQQATSKMTNSKSYRSFKRHPNNSGDIFDLNVAV